MILKKNILVSLIFLLPFVLACSQKTEVHYTEEFPNVNHPQILIWFWDDNIITNQQYRKDIDKIAAESPFDLIYLTSRFLDQKNGFWNTPRLQPYLADAVDYARQKGLKIGIQLYPGFSDRTEDSESLIAESECILDAQGRGKVKNLTISARSNHAFDTGLTKVWLFQKTGDGLYKESSLKEAPPEWFSVKTNDDFSVEVSVAAPAAYSAYTAYVITTHYYDYYDVFGEAHVGFFKQLLDDYAGIPFAGTALDENGNLKMNFKKFNLERIIIPDRAWGDHFAESLRKTYQVEPYKLLLDMRYAPENKPQVRIKAINTYFEFLGKGPTQTEEDFYEYSKKLFGKDCFIGFHSTFHNSFSYDDIWRTGCNWWDLPRVYGQTDETQSLPDRMGIGMSGSKPVMFNMYYSMDKEAMYHEALDNAPYGVREDYHAWNDNHGWGKSLNDDDFLEGVKPVESRVRLLNHFDPAPPRLPLLIIYNFPYIFNWYPDKDQQNFFGTRETDMQAVALDIWNAGYPCATVPSTWLDRGIVKVREDGKVQIKDRIFDAVIFMNPQYAKPASFAFMQELLEKNGRLMIKGEASEDFNGDDCSTFFTGLMHKALPYDMNEFAALGLLKNPVQNGIFLQDGSVVMANYQSVKDKKNTEFNVKIGNDEYSGSYEGIFALKVGERGIEKMACGNFQSLQKNGLTILKTETPTDIFLTKIKGKTVITLKGIKNSVDFQ
jgi:hypothetical protein